jgi:hypothetical protein
MYDLNAFVSFTEALAKLLFKGRGELAPKDIIDHRLETCKNCAFFTGRRCRICGCGISGRNSLLNKLAYPMEKCPHNPPKWDALT